jgi:hypothetical protein
MKKQIKVKPVTKTVSGLIFFPTSRPDKFYPSVLAWIEAGTPDNAFVYDSADTLLGCRIPIIDGTFHRGMFTRIPRLLKPIKASIIFPSTLLVKILPAKIVDSVAGIRGANTKDHHKLNYS